MRRFWTAAAVALSVIFPIVGCNDFGNTFQSNTGAVLAFVSPSDIPAGSSSFTLTLTGAGFVAKTKVQWNGKAIPTTVTLDAGGNVQSVTATVDASLIGTPGVAAVNTINPASGAGNNGLSNTINFIINNPANPLPTVTSVSPKCATVGNPLSLTVTGTNFMNGSATSTPPQVSTLNWTLGPSQFQFTVPAATINSTQITVSIPASDISVAGTAVITISNPPSLPLPNISGSSGSGGGTSVASAASSVTVQSTACPAAVQSGAHSEAETAIAEETPAVSLDGRYVAYTAVQDAHAQIFLRDTCESAPASCQPRTSLISMAPNGDAASGDSHSPSMSSDGRYVAFSSTTEDLVENAPPGRQVYLRDTCAGAGDSCKTSTVLVSTDARGALVGAESILPSLSSSGRFVAFVAITASQAPNPPSREVKSSAVTTNSGFRQIFVRDTCLGAANCTPKTTRISLQPGDGIGSNAPPAGPALSGNGKRVALAGANAATLFTRSVAVDDRVFLAITSSQP